MRRDVIIIAKYHRTRARKSAPSHLIGLTPARILIYTSQAGNPYRSRDRLKFTYLGANDQMIKYDLNKLILI